MAEALLTPKKLPDAGHLVVVDLEAIHVAIAELDLSPFTHERLTYNNTDKPEDTVARMKNASIVFSALTPVTAAAIGGAPHLKCIVTRGIGTDHIDLDECRRRGVRVLNTPGASVETVAEHALSLYFATRRRIVALHNAVMDFDAGRPNNWKAKGSLGYMLRDPQGQAPNTCEQEVVGLIGFGPLDKHQLTIELNTPGQRVAKVFRALGMEVRVAARKQPSSKAGENGTANGSVTTATSAAPNGNSAAEPRVPFADVLRSATVLVMCVPLLDSTRGMITAAELALMRPDALIVNVSRGGIVDEPAVLDALARGALGGYGTDVFETEPAGSGAESVLLRPEAAGLNVVFTPHLAWRSDMTTRNIARIVKASAESWARGHPQHVVV